jgi:hypothetical protein
MAPSLQDLIDHLLAEIALCGDQGGFLSRISVVDLLWFSTIAACCCIRTTSLSIPNLSAAPLSFIP